MNKSGICRRHYRKWGVKSAAANGLYKWRLLFNRGGRPLVAATADSESDQPRNIGLAVSRNSIPRVYFKGSDGGCRPLIVTVQVVQKLTKVHAYKRHAAPPTAVCMPGQSVMITSRLSSTQYWLPGDLAL